MRPLPRTLLLATLLALSIGCFERGGPNGESWQDIPIAPGMSVDEVNVALHRHPDAITPLDGDRKLYQYRARPWTLATGILVVEERFFVVANDRVVEERKTP